jgi:hypothetical protein
MPKYKRQHEAGHNITRSMIKPKKHDQQIIVVGYQDNNIIFSSH